MFLAQWSLSKASTHQMVRHLRAQPAFAPYPIGMARNVDPSRDARCVLATDLQSSSTRGQAVVARDVAPDSEWGLSKSHSRYWLRACGSVRERV